MRNLLLIALVLNAISGKKTAKTAPLILSIVWGDEKLALEQPNACSSGTVVINKLKFILTNLKTSPKSKPMSVLFDLADSSSWTVQIPTKETTDTLTGLLGVDSLSSISGIKSGALDPRNGMYWTWNSGYIFFKLEGRINGKAFIWHIGGYSGTQAAMFPIKIASKQAMYHLTLDLKKLMENASSFKSEIMLPGAEAVEFSKKLAQSFK